MVNEGMPRMEPANLSVLRQEDSIREIGSDDIEEIPGGTFTEGGERLVVEQEGVAQENQQEPEVQHVPHQYRKVVGKKGNIITEYGMELDFQTSSLETEVAVLNIARVLGTEKDYVLNREIFNELRRKLRIEPVFDVTATKDNSRLPKFITKEQDILKQVFAEGTELYSTPPFENGFMEQLIRRAIEQGWKMLLVLPRRVDAEYWKLLNTEGIVLRGTEVEPRRSMFVQDASIRGRRLNARPKEKIFAFVIDGKKAKSYVPRI